MTFDRLLVIFAAIVAAVQGWKWVRDRRGEHGLKRMGESYADKDDVRAIRADLHRLKNERGELEVAVPALAARLHLEQRRRDLASTLGKAWDEYRDVDAKLNEDDPAAGLSPALVDILRTEIEPQYRAKVRGRRGTRLLLVIMAAALILPAPFTPRSLLYLLGNAVYIIAKLPQLMGHFALTAGVLMTCFGIVAGFIVGSWLKSTRILSYSKATFAFGRSRDRHSRSSGQYLVILDHVDCA